MFEELLNVNSKRITKSRTDYKFNQFEINTKKEADSFCLVNSGSPIMVTRFSFEENIEYVYLVINV